MEDTSKPLVTVIIPLYNCADYIEECLDSVINQKYTHIEVIVVDDGSTDEGAEMVEAYSKGVKLIRQSNLGVTAARKTGVDASKGEWIMFVDADDSVEDDIISAWVPFMRDDIDIIIGKMNCDRIVSSEQLPYDIMEMRHFPKAPWLKLFRRSLFDASNALEIPRNIIWGEDLLMLFRLSMVAQGNVVYSKRRGYKYRVHPSQITKTFRVTGDYEQLFHVLFLQSIPKNKINRRLIEGSVKLRLQYYERILKDVKYTRDDVHLNQWFKTLNDDIESIDYRPSLWYRLLLRYGNGGNIKSLRSIKWFFRLIKAY